MRFWASLSSTAYITVAMLLVASPVQADLYSAHVAYEKHDYKKAFEEFKELAELGQPQAQYTLAVLYVRGEGIPTSLTYAHGWAALAGENGEAKGAALAAELE